MVSACGKAHHRIQPTAGTQQTAPLGTPRHEAKGPLALSPPRARCSKSGRTTRQAAAWARMPQHDSGSRVAPAPWRRGARFATLRPRSSESDSPHQAPPAAKGRWHKSGRSTRTAPAAGGKERQPRRPTRSYRAGGSRLVQRPWEAQSAKSRVWRGSRPRGPPGPAVVLSSMPPLTGRQRRPSAIPARSASPSSPGGKKPRLQAASTPQRAHPAPPPQGGPRQNPERLRRDPPPPATWALRRTSSGEELYGWSHQRPPQFAPSPTRHEHHAGRAASEGGGRLGGRGRS